MNDVALVLVLAGSLLHLGWNIHAKGAQDKLAFLWLTLAPAAVVGVGLLVSTAISSGLPLAGLVCIVASGIVHASYFWLLSGAYAHGDLSFVYPYCRGLGALLATGAGLALLGDRPSLLGFVGIGLTLLAPGLEAASARKSRSSDARASLLTLLTGASIGTYSVVDKVGVGLIDPVTYLGGLLAGAVLLLTPAIARGGRLRAELRASRHRPLVAMLFLTSAYGVVLFAMQITPVTYVVAARASGIAVSGLAGVLFFHEEIGVVRWIAIGMVAAGVLCVGVA